MLLPAISLVPRNQDQPNSTSTPCCCCTVSWMAFSARSQRFSVPRNLGLSDWQRRRSFYFWCWWTEGWARHWNYLLSQLLSPRRQRQGPFGSSRYSTIYKAPHKSEKYTKKVCSLNTELRNPHLPERNDEVTGFLCLAGKTDVIVGNKHLARNMHLVERCPQGTVCVSIEAFVLGQPESSTVALIFGSSIQVSEEK